MNRGLGRSFRQLAAVLALVVAVVATVADEPQEPPALMTTSPTAAISVDSANPIVARKFTVHVDPGAAIGLGSASLSVILAAPPGADPRVRIVAIDPGVENGLSSPVPSPASPPSQWPVDLSSGTALVSIPVVCVGPAPCDRGFRVIAFLGAGQVDPVTITWHVETTLEYDLDYQTFAYPSGVGANVTIGPSVAVPGDFAQLDVSTGPQSISLGADHPAAARIVEVRLAADQDPVGGPRPVGSLDWSVLSPGGQPLGSSVAQLAVYELPVPGVAPSAALAPDSPAALERGGDPFVDCLPGTECVRTFLVDVSWTVGPPAPFTWQLTVHRLDIDAALAAPPDALQVLVTQRIDPVSGAPATLHLEGTMVYVPNTTGRIGGPVQDPMIRLFVFVAQVGSSPLDYAALLPTPGSMTMHAEFVGAPPPGSIDFSIPVGPFGRSLAQLSLGSVPQGVTVNPFADCDPPLLCPSFRIVGIPDSSATSVTSTVSIRWTVDIAVYSYPGVRRGVTGTASQ